MPVLYCIDDHTFVVESEIREPDSSSSYFLFNIALTTQGLLCFHTNFKMFCSNSVRNVIGNLIEIALNLSVALGSIVILNIVILSIEEHGIFFHLFVSSSISFYSIL